VSNSPSTPTWLGSDRALARSVARPVNRFLHVEAASGLLLLAAALAAMVWANPPWSASYTDLWASDIGVTVAGHSLVLDLRHWLNDGLMTLFFSCSAWKSSRSWSTGS
jgi:Na+:H+ antiporter, NhaA family